MKIINREMGGGKTYALVELMLEPGNEDVIYVAPTVSQAQGIAFPYAAQITGQATKELRDRFISVAQIDNLRGRVVRFVFDEVDGILGYLAGAPVIAIAGTDEDLKRGQLDRRRYGGYAA